MARWSKERQAEAREVMLAAARDAFEADGFDGATMRQIAEASNVAVGTLFNYFPDKQALLREALYADLELVGDSLDLDGATTLAELFVAIAQPFYAYYCERPKLSATLLRDTLFASGPMSSSFRAQAARVGAIARDAVCKLQRAGRLSESASPDVIVLAFFGHYYFVLMSQLGSGDIATMLRQIALLGAQLEAGVGEQHGVHLQD